MNIISQVLSSKILFWFWKSCYQGHWCILKNEGSYLLIENMLRCSTYAHYNHISSFFHKIDTEKNQENSDFYLVKTQIQGCSNNSKIKCNTNYTQCIVTLFVFTVSIVYSMEDRHISLRWLLVSFGNFSLFSPSVIRKWYDMNRRKICQNQSKASYPIPFFWQVFNRVVMSLFYEWTFFLDFTKFSRKIKLFD